MQNVNVSKDKEFDIKQRPGFVYGEKKRPFEWFYHKQDLC